VKILKILVKLYEETLQSIVTISFEVISVFNVQYLFKQGSR